MITKLLEKYKKAKKENFNIHINEVRRGGIWAVYRLFNRYFIKSFTGPFFTFLFPVLIYLILGNLMSKSLLFAGVVAMSAMSTGMTGMPVAILDLKKSVLLKRIGASPVKPFKFTVVIITYYTAMILLSVLWLMIWALIFFKDPSMFNHLGTITGFFGFLYGNILNIIMSLSIGFVISTFAKSTMAAQAIGMMIYFPATFLSGQFIAIDSIARISGLQWASRFMPFRYTTMIVVEAWSGDAPDSLISLAGASPSTLHANPFSLHDYGALNTRMSIDFDKISTGAKTPLQAATDAANSYNALTILYSKDDHIVAYAVPYAVIITSGIVSVKKFTWSQAR